MKPLRVIISGGGTGGHIFPAIAIAKALQALNKDVEILFVGAEGKMEMEKVPAAGYQIVGLPIAGIQRRLTLRNLLVPFKVIRSLILARKIVRSFRPDVAVGVGGYASGPLLRAAGSMGIKTLLQEQNSYPGLTNKLLARKADRICVAYTGLEAYFPSNKMVLTGNPVRPEVLHTSEKKRQAVEQFNLDPSKKTVLVVGGSLGARTINLAIRQAIPGLVENNLQVIWQTGKHYHNNAWSFADGLKSGDIRVFDFIREMDLAYAAADIVVSRAGAMSISELCIVGKPCILVPSPNVAEDHQTKNAMSLVHAGAALLVTDADAAQQLGPAILRVLASDDLQAGMRRSLLALARPDADRMIAEEVIRLADH